MATNKNDNTLRHVFRDMDPNRAQDIREAYYKAVEGLHALVEVLEVADMEGPQPGGELIGEHLIACEAVEAIRKSRLGSVL